jgi:hypothetical protein
MRSVLLLLCTLAIVPSVTGQATPEKQEPKGFEKKFLWGVAYQQSWSTIQGRSLPKDYFSKPSLGFSVSAEYYPVSFIGIGVGAGYQQRGAGVTHHNTLPVAFLRPDSTHLERLRFNTLEFPISIFFRTPMDIVKGLRLGGSIAVVPMVNLHSHDVFVDVEPSVRDTDVVNDVSSSYFKKDAAYQFSFGPEIDSGSSGTIKLHFLYSLGTTNVYKTEQGIGHNQTMGLRLTVMF